MPVHFRFVAFSLVLFAAQLLIPTVNSDDEAGGEGDAEVEEVEPEVSCKKSIFNLVQGFVTASLKCLGGKLVLRSPFELTTRFYCIVKCSMMEVGVIGPDGRVDEVAALFYFQDAIPESIREPVIEGAQPCLAMASNFNPSEYYCQSYSPFTQCVIRSLMLTYSPYVIECFGTPGLGFFFSFIDLMVPRASSSSSSPEAINDIRRRLTEQRLQVRRRQSVNSTRGSNSTRLLASPINNPKKHNNASI